MVKELKCRAAWRSEGSNGWTDRTIRRFWRMVGSAHVKVERYKMEESQIEVPIGLPDITPELVRVSGFFGGDRSAQVANDGRGSRFISGAVSLRAAASQAPKTARSLADAGSSAFRGSPGDSGKRPRRAAKPPAEGGAERTGGFVADFFSQIVQ